MKKNKSKFGGKRVEHTLLISSNAGLFFVKVKHFRINFVIIKQSLINHSKNQYHVKRNNHTTNLLH